MMDDELTAFWTEAGNGMMFCGKRVPDMSRDELIAAIAILANREQQTHQELRRRTDYLLGLEAIS